MSGRVGRGPLTQRPARFSGRKTLAPWRKPGVQCVGNVPSPLQRAKDASPMAQAWGIKIAPLTYSPGGA